MLEKVVHAALDGNYNNQAVAQKILMGRIFPNSIFGKRTGIKAEKTSLFQLSQRMNQR